MFCTAKVDKRGALLKKTIFPGAPEHMPMDMSTEDIMARLERMGAGLNTEPIVGYKVCSSGPGLLVKHFPATFESVRSENATKSAKLVLPLALSVL